jgi:hypothetical protein
LQKSNHLLTRGSSPHKKKKKKIAFECGFPGCTKRFSVSSNAKRHLRTHGVGLTPSDDPTPLPYVVDFEEPVVVAAMESDRDDPCSPRSEPVSLRWMPLGAGSRRSCRVVHQQQQQQQQQQDAHYHIH